MTSEAVLLDGQVVDVECQAKGAQPKAVVQWFLDDVPLNASASTMATDATKTTSILHLEARADMNGRRLVCKGFNPHLPDSELVDHWILDVHCTLVCFIFLKSRPDSFFLLYFFFKTYPTALHSRRNRIVCTGGYAEIKMRFRLGQGDRAIFFGTAKFVDTLV